MFAWSQLDFSAIPVSISAVSLTSIQTMQNVSSKRRFQRIQNVQEWKKHQKKETSSCICLCSFCFWGEVSNSWILNEIGRNFLLGNGKKIAKCLMRTLLAALPSSMVGSDMGREGSAVTLPVVRVVHGTVLCTSSTLDSFVRTPGKEKF